MSNYYGWGRHPVTNEIERCNWLDDYFGHHKYGAQFADGVVYPDVTQPRGVVAMCQKCEKIADDECDAAGHPFRYVEQLELQATPPVG